MPRRVYTYGAGDDWDVYNLLSSIGAAILAVGLVVVAANLLASLRRGAAAGPDPWRGNTLEWSTSSPPPAYNFPSIPVVSSADPNWDREDREADRRRLERGELVLPDGHETVETTLASGELRRVLGMPGESLWPLAVAASLSLVAGGLIGGINAIAIVGIVLVLVSVAGWNRPGGEESVA
jgi:hypothetical protein